MKNFAITGVAGYVAPRHLRAIEATNNRLVVALDPNDSVGFLDRHSLTVDFFTEFERYDRHLEKLRRGPDEDRVHYVSVCSPNYLHDAHCRQALRIGADVICEKPLVLNPWNLDALQELEGETGKRINTVLQLRLHPQLVALKDSLPINPVKKHEVSLTYVTVRGKWYNFSWKNDIQKSGGLATNIGIHFFDMLIWLFGKVVVLKVYHADPTRVAGSLELERAYVNWFLSIDPADLPFEAKPGERTTYRSITVNDREVEFTEGFTDLHTRIYEEVLVGRGFGIDDIRPATELAYNIRHTSLSPRDGITHDFLK